MSTMALLFSSHPNVETAFTAIGMLAVASLLLSFLKLIIQVFLWPGRSVSASCLPVDEVADATLQLNRSMSSALGVSPLKSVITGCTDGIGREFAMQLAEAGFNVVLLSRTPAKLKHLANEILFRHRVETRTCAIDFSLPSNDAGYAAVADTMSGLPIGVLVNNVGTSNLIPTIFDEIPAEEIDSQLEVNIHAAVRMSRLVLPTMRRRGNGLILNMGSLSGRSAAPLIATYSATKAFLSTWSQCLAEEYRPFGIMVQNVPAAFVITKLAPFESPSFGIPMPKEFVKCVLAKIGVKGGSISVTANSNPYWSHALGEWMYTKLDMPSSVIRASHKTAKGIAKRLRDVGGEKMKDA